MPRPSRSFGRRAARVLLGTGLSVLLLAGLYAAAAFALPRWPAADGRAPATGAAAAPASDVEAYVVSNGVHTDLVLPRRSPRIDWATVFEPAAFLAVPPDADFVAIGWGDRDFYLNTPRWRDLTVRRALAALSGTGRSLVHVTWLRRGDLGNLRWRLPLDPVGHAALVQHVLDTLPGGPAPAQAVAGARYGATDAFFEARGAYDAFTTCNTWTGRGLRAAGVPVSPWTPFAANVVARLPHDGVLPP